MYRTISHLKNPTFKSLFSCSRPDHSPISSRLFHSSPLLNYSRQRKEDGDNEDVSLINRDPDSPPKLLVVQPRLRPDTLLQVKLNEALNLANSLEEHRDGDFNTELCDKEMPPHVIVQNPSVRSDKVRSDMYFGTGTVDTIKCHLNAAESQSGVDAVFVNTILSGIQQRNLEGVWGVPVLDRVGLIIEIFNAHAYTKEAKLQAELAALMYRKTRLVRARGSDGRSTFGAGGEAEVVSARGRGSGGRGFISGAGETELQLQRRRILERRSRLLSQIEDVRRTRALQRASRKRHGGSNGQALATVAVVGYTNAGKSTLVSALSETDLYSDDRMFATVDPRLRSVALPSGRKVLLSDTVGFISDLPIQLVEAFHATLEEVAEADLLVHVLDSSAPDLEEQRSTVLGVLEQIGVSEEKLNNMIEVWNKIDLQNEEMDAGEYLGDYKDDEASSLSEAEDDDVVSELSQVAEEEEACSLSGEKDGDVAAELLLGDSNESYNDDDNNGDIESELLMDLEETIDDQQGNKSDHWLSTEDDHETEDDQDVPSKGWETLNDQQRDCLKDCRIIRKGSHSQTQHVPHVKTSGVMGVGLQELLVLIDEKLMTKEVKRGSLDRKWRPPRTDDAGIAVEQ